MATTKVSGNLINDLPSGVIATADLADNVLSADSTGRAKMADGFVDHAKVAAGAVIQVVNTQTGAVATGTTVLPSDDTIPQSTEGDQYMSLAVTPRMSTSRLKIDVVLVVSSSAAGSSVLTAALFQDSTANALAAVSQVTSAANNQTQISFTHWMTSGATSSTTFKVRAGGSAAGTTTFNGHSGGRHMGGVMASSITITEIKA